MSKKNKKRNKAYTGADAASTRPTVHRYVAVERSALGEWWQARKKPIKIITAVAGMIFIIAYLLFEFFRLIF